MEGEILSVFSADVFRRLSLFILRFSKVLSVLSFFSESFAQRARNWESGVFWVLVWALKCPCFASRRRRKKSSPFLSLVFSEFYFCYGCVFAPPWTWATNSVLCVVCVAFIFRCIRVRVFHGFTCLLLGISLSPFFRDSGAAVSPSSFFLLSSSSSLSSPFLACTKDRLL